MGSFTRSSPRLPSWLSQRPTGCNYIPDPRNEGWFESGNGDGQEEGEDRDETAERAEAAERGWRSGEVREEITSIIGLPTTCQARCEDYP